MASVHYDQLENTSLKNSAINGYPSLLVVGTDGEPATFESENGITNAMPDANNMKTMKRLVTTPVSNMIPKENNVGLPTSPSAELANKNNLNLSPINTSTLSANTGNVSPNNTLNSLMLSPNNTLNSLNLSPNNAFNAENTANINESMLSMNESLPPNLEEDSLNAYEGTNSAVERANRQNNSAIEVNTASNIPQNVNTRNSANTQGTTPILSGGRLYRTLTTKNRRLRRVKSVKRKSHSRQSKRKN